MLSEIDLHCVGSELAHPDVELSHASADHTAETALLTPMTGGALKANVGAHPDTRLIHFDPAVFNESLSHCDMHRIMRAVLSMAR